MTLRRVLRCQVSATSGPILRRHLRHYKAGYGKRFYWEIRWAKVPTGLKARLARLRYCESTNNYRASNGSHFGAYQYDYRTWGEAGGSGDPRNASPREQDVRTAWFFPSHTGRWACKV